MKVDSALVSRVAALASLRLSEDERALMADQLTRIVEHVEALQDIPDELLTEVGSAPAMPLRKDEVGPCLPAADVAANAPTFAHGHFVVPRVISRA